MNEKTYGFKKIIFTIIIIFIVIISTSIPTINAFIENNEDEPIDYEELFEEKEKIHLVLPNVIRSFFLQMGHKCWDKRSELFQKITAQPVNDEESEHFSYWAKPCFQIGLPDQHFATMITPEGHLYTGSAELEFFAGEDLQPIKQRIWTLNKGYLPCINYQFEKDDLTYKIQAFQYWLDEQYHSPAVNFIKIKITNPTDDTKEARTAIGFKYGGRDHRPLEMVLSNVFNPFWQYEMAENYTVRNQELVYLWDAPPTEKLQDLDNPYQKSFHCYNPLKTVCIVDYQLSLHSGEMKEFTFKMPLYPLSIENQTDILALKNAEYEHYLAKMENFWEEIIENGSRITVMEDKVMNASKSYIVHNFMCQNIISNDEIVQVVNRFQYNDFWITICYFSSLMYNFYNYHNISKKCLRHILKCQDESGCITSQAGYLRQIGVALAAFGEYIKMTNDSSFAEEIFPTVEKTVNWLKNEILNDRFGLMPPANTKDGPFLVGRYTSHNLWTLIGLDGAIIVAKAADEEEASLDFQCFHDAYREHFIKQLRIASARNNGVIPPGMDVNGYLYWGSLLASYRDNLLDPFDPLINTTFDYYRKNHMKEGLATRGNALSGWRTESLTTTSLRRGEQENVLHDFYSMLLHTGSCHQGFEYAVYPSARDYATRASLPLSLYINITPY